MHWRPIARRTAAGCGLTLALFVPAGAALAQPPVDVPPGERIVDESGVLEDPSALAADVRELATQEGITLTANGGKLNGEKMFVLDGHIANLIIVAAKSGSGVSLYAVQGDAAGLTKTALSTMDQTRKQAKLEFKDGEGKLIGTEGQGWSVLEKVLDLAAVGLAAEQVGGAQPR